MSWDVLKDVCKYIRMATGDLSARNYVDFLRELSEWALVEAEVQEWRISEVEFDDE